LTANTISVTSCLFVIFALRGLTEFGEPTRKEPIMDLGPEGEKAGMFGAYDLVRDLVVSFAAFSNENLTPPSPKANFVYL
jgi:hypothetical protein